MLAIGVPAMLPALALRRDPEPPVDRITPAVPVAPLGRPSGFSAPELGAVLTALEPLTRPAEGGRADGADAIARGTLERLAELRQNGADAVLLVVSTPGGGGLGTIMSYGDFLAAVTSEDPESLGSYRAEPGAPLVSFRDLVRRAIGQDAGTASPDPRQAMAAAIAAMIARERGEDAPDTSRAETLRGLASRYDSLRDAPGAAEGFGISIVMLPAERSGASSALRSPAGGEASPVLDLAV